MSRTVQITFDARGRGTIWFTVTNDTRTIDGIVVRDEFKQKNPELVLAYLKEYDRLATMYEKQPQEVVKVLSPFLQMTPEKTMDYINTFHPVPVKELASEKWMGLPGAKDTGVSRTLQSQAAKAQTGAKA